MFPLADAQRIALDHLLAARDGETLAAIGPPGTGKTTLLLSVVATSSARDLPPHEPGQWEFDFLKEADAGMPVKELCRKHSFSGASFYKWHAKFGGMEVSEARRLKDLEAENGRLKKPLAEAMLDMEALKVVVKGKH